MPDADALDEHLAHHVQAAVSEVYPGDFVVRWSFISEVLDARTGERVVVTATHADATAPEIVGLLQHALHMEAAAVVERRLNGS